MFIVWKKSLATLVGQVVCLANGKAAQHVKNAVSHISDTALRVWPYKFIQPSSKTTSSEPSPSSFDMVITGPRDESRCGSKVRQRRGHHLMFISTKVVCPCMVSYYQVGYQHVRFNIPRSLRSSDSSFDSTYRGPSGPQVLLVYFVWSLYERLIFPEHAFKDLKTKSQTELVATERLPSSPIVETNHADFLCSRGCSTRCSNCRRR